MAARRKPKNETAGTESLPEPAPQPTKPQSTEEAFQRLRQRANAGDREAQGALRKFLNSNPTLWKRFGDLARMAERNLIHFITDGEWLISEAVKRQAGEMRRELAGPSPTPLEEMAVERIVACWLQLQHVEMMFSRIRQDLAWAKYWLKRQEQANKLFDQAVHALAVIRDMLPPALQPSAPALAGLREDKGDENGSMPGAGEIGGGKPPTEAVPGLDRRPDRGWGVNRIGGLFNNSLDGAPSLDAEAFTNGSLHLNGHGRSLNRLLVPSRDG